MKRIAGMLVLVLVSAGAVSSASAAPPSIYKCAGPNGSVVFSQMPCGKDAEQVDTSRALRTGTSPNLQGVSDYAELARIDSDCRNEGDAIGGRYAADIAGVDRRIAALSNSMRYSSNNLAGATRDSGIQSEIASLNERKSAIQRMRRDDLAVLNARCSERRESERKAQAEREAKAREAADTAAHASSGGDVP